MKNFNKNDPLDEYINHQINIKTQITHQIKQKQQTTFTSPLRQTLQKFIEKSADQSLYQTPQQVNQIIQLQQQFQSGSNASNTIGIINLDRNIGIIQADITKDNYIIPQKPKLNKKAMVRKFQHQNLMSQLNQLNNSHHVNTKYTQILKQVRSEKKFDQIIDSKEKNYSKNDIYNKSHIIDQAAKNDSQSSKQHTNFQFDLVEDKNILFQESLSQDEKKIIQLCKNENMKLNQKIIDSALQINQLNEKLNELQQQEQCQSRENFYNELNIQNQIGLQKLERQYMLEEELKLLKSQYEEDNNYKTNLQIEMESNIFLQNLLNQKDKDLFEIRKQNDQKLLELESELLQNDKIINEKSQRLFKTDYELQKVNYELKLLQKKTDTEQQNVIDDSCSKLIENKKQSTKTKNEKQDQLINYNQNFLLKYQDKIKLSKEDCQNLQYKLTQIQNSSRYSKNSSINKMLQF